MAVNSFVRNIKDQFHRGGKVNNLSDELRQADSTVEFIRSVSGSLDKHLPPLLYTMKIEDCVLANTLDKVATSKPESERGCLLQTVKESYQAERNLFTNQKDLDKSVKERILLQIQDLLTKEFPELNKSKRNYEKALEAVKKGVQKNQEKQSEQDDLEMKLDQSQDALACDLFNMTMRETEMCNHFLQLYILRKEYYQKALQHLDSVIPKLKQLLDESSLRRVFGKPLETHLENIGRPIAYPIELLVCALISHGLEEEGLFRIAGGSGKTRRLKLSLDAGCLNLETAVNQYDRPTIAGALKSYLRELPCPLMSADKHHRWMAAARVQGTDQEKLEAVKRVVDELPVAQRDNLGYLVRFFHLLTRSQELNKMTSHNLAIVLAPSLMWAEKEDHGMFLSDAGIFPSIVEMLISSCDAIFPGPPISDAEFFRYFKPLSNGHLQDGIDNKAFNDTPSPPVESEIKRSLSANNMASELATPTQAPSPKPLTRKKNKPAAPIPPSGPTKTPVRTPPRPIAATTLPRNSKTKERKTDEPVTLSEVTPSMTSQTPPLVSTTSQVATFIANEKKVKCHASTNTENSHARDKTSTTYTNPEERAKITTSLKETWLKSATGPNASTDKPVVPTRPAGLQPRRPPTATANAANYENVDELQLQRAQVAAAGDERNRTEDRRSSTDDDHTKHSGSEKPVRPPKPESMKNVVNPSSLPVANTQPSGDQSDDSQPPTQLEQQISVQCLPESLADEPRIVLERPSTPPPPPPIALAPSSTDM